jgi:hypothetical protein
MREGLICIVQAVFFAFDGRPNNALDPQITNPTAHGIAAFETQIGTLLSESADAKNMLKS